MSPAGRFLILSWPFPGHLFPQIAIARSLRERGHVCAFYTGDQSREVLEKEGFEVFPFRRVDEEAVYETVFSPRRGGVLRFRELQRFKQTLRRWLVDTIPDQVADIEAVLKTFKPDVIASDPTMWSAFLVLHETHTIPVAVSSFVPACMVPGPEAPIFGPGLPPPHTPFSRLFCRVAAGVAGLLSRDFLGAVNRQRARFNLSPIHETVTEYTGRMPLYLVPSVPSFDYNRSDLPASVHYAGPYVWNAPKVEEPPAWLEKVDTSRPWVHVTEGTMHLDHPFLLEASAQGLSNGPFEVIMTTGNLRNPEDIDLDRDAKNLHLARWISHGDLFKRTHVVVTTGGAGTVLAALQAGVPLVVVPTEWDKPEIAARIVDRGVGIRIGPRRCTPARIRSAVDRILGDPGYRQRVEVLQGEFLKWGGAARAAELLESLLQD